MPRPLPPRRRPPRQPPPPKPARPAAPPTTAPTTGPAVRAEAFESRKVYQSKQRPSYTSWASFFPGEDGRWYIGCEEVTTPENPQSRASTQWVYEMSLPRGYDKSKYRMELVLLKSDDDG